MTSIQYEHLRHLIEKMMAYYSIPGMALGIVDKGQVEMMDFGVRNGKGEPFTADTISGIGSCSKSMTSFAVMKLAEKGLLNIDRPVAEYIPGFALWDEKASLQVTLRDMMCHRTGVGGHDGAWPDNSISRVQYLSRLKYLKPNRPFRTEAQYSNVMCLVPLMMAHGVGANGSRSLATGVIGGMIVGTLALLFLVPSLFIVFQYIQERVKHN